MATDLPTYIHNISLGTARATQFSLVRAPPVATLVSSFLWAPPVATQFSVVWASPVATLVLSFLFIATFLWGGDSSVLS